MVNSTPPNTLLAGAACYKCIPTGMQSEVVIYLLAQLLNATNGASTDPAVLMQQASCYKCIPPGLQGPVSLYILDQLATALGA